MENILTQNVILNIKIGNLIIMNLKNLFKKNSSLSDPHLLKVIINLLLIILIRKIYMKIFVIVLKIVFAVKNLKH